MPEQPAPDHARRMAWFAWEGCGGEAQAREAGGELPWLGALEIPHFLSVHTIPPSSRRALRLIHRSAGGGSSHTGSAPHCAVRRAPAGASALAGLLRARVRWPRPGGRSGWPFHIRADRRSVLSESPGSPAPARAGAPVGLAPTRRNTARLSGKNRPGNRPHTAPRRLASTGYPAASPPGFQILLHPAGRSCPDQRPASRG